MNKNFIRKQKILRLATVNSKGSPHIVPVWYSYINNKFYVGTNTRTTKARNIKHSPKVSFCIDKGVKSPEIVGIMGIGKARLILENRRVKSIAKKILLRYFKSLKNRSAQCLLEDTNCVIEIMPKKMVSWKY
ncbi:MAG TPA: pyridoxamine 5'-phosphate oxidase family protein [Candidatus Nitrosotalea sp.]|nr:pyridoxamine 5'-phosphate oxidase family protein [Candidatus Nitrosotalea sp.]